MPESKFGFIPEEDELSPDLALQFEPKPVQRALYAVEELDRVAEAAGFVSREPSASSVHTGRRRRIQREPASRALAIRMTESQFARFLRYADHHQSTYSEAITTLLDLAGEPN